MLDKILSAFGVRGRGQPYHFRPGIAAGDLGVGTGALGFMKPQSDPLYWPVPPHQAVQGDLGPLQGAHMKWEQLVPTVSLAGNGAYLSGQMALQALAQYQSGN